MLRDTGWGHPIVASGLCLIVETEALLRRPEGFTVERHEISILGVAAKVREEGFLDVVCTNS